MSVNWLSHFQDTLAKDLSVIIVRAKGKGNFVKNLSVRRQVVSDAIHWLIKNNPHYSDIKL